VVGAGWIFGHLIDGVKAQYAWVPFADTSTHKVPEGLSDEQVLYLADILPTGYKVGVLNGRVQPGDTVVGAEPIGLATIVDARLFSPTAFDATATATADRARGVIEGLTDGLGVDVAVEAVGIPVRSNSAPR
jgi:alcohol dehydrogenase